MAAYSEEFVHNFKDFNSIINEIRTKYGISDIGIAYENNYGSENDRNDRPMSFLFFLGELDNIKDKMYQNYDYEINLYKSLIDIMKVMPGFPGGGRSFIEVPLNVSILELPNIIDQIKMVIDKFRDNFKYDQNTKLYRNFIDEHGLISNIDFLTCLPENGGSSQISFSFKYVMQDIILVIAVDSYWQPCVDMMVRFIKACIKHVSFVNSNTKRGIENSGSLVFQDIYNKFKDTLLFNRKKSDNSSTYQSSRKTFDIVDFSYCEYMGFLHRNAIITKLLHLISKIKNSNNEKLIGSYKNLLTNAYVFPSIQKDNADAIEKLWLNTNDSVINIQLIDHIYIRNAVHSTILFVHEYNDDTKSIYLSKRIFNQNDFLSGDAFIFYGDHDGGFYINMPKTWEDYRLMIDADKIKYIALKNRRNKYKNHDFFDENYEYTSRESNNSYVINDNLYMSTDIFHPNWLQFTSSDRIKSTQKLYGMSFSDIKNDEEDEENTHDLSKEIIPFQLYHEDVGLDIKYKKINNSFLVFDAIYQYLKDNNIGIGDSRIAHLESVHCVITVKMMKSLDNMSIKELVDMQIERYERLERHSIIDKKLNSKRDKIIIYSQNHTLTEIRRYFEKHKKEYVIERTEYDKKYGDESFDYGSSSDTSQYNRIYHFCKFEKIK